MKTISELSTELLGRYKKAAGAAASAADAAGDFAKGNKRFAGITKATKKQFANSAKPKPAAPAEEHDMSDEHQIDELNRGTMLRYSTKATKTVGSLDPVKAANRIKSIQRAVSKLTGSKVASGIKIVEDAEQLDELSKDTLHSYTDKVVDPVWGIPRHGAIRGKLKQRLSGLARAHKRTMAPDKPKANEEAELEEAAAKKLHPDALHISHVGGGKYKVHAVGKNLEDGIKVGEHLTDSELDDAHEMGARVKEVKPTNEAAMDDLAPSVDDKAVSLRRELGGRRAMDQAAKERIISMSDFKLDSQGRRIKAHRMRFESVQQYDEGDNNILIQLKKCVDAADLKGGAEVTFDDGSTAFVESADAHYVIESMLNLKPAARLIMQETIQRSPNHLSAAMTNISEVTWFISKGVRHSSLDSDPDHKKFQAAFNAIPGRVYRSDPDAPEPPKESPEERRAKWAKARADYAKRQKEKGSLGDS